MSTRRNMPGAYGQNQPVGPSGERLCRWCRGLVPKGRRTYCSNDCVHEWRIRSDPGYLRHRVYQRDKGVCAKCGKDTDAMTRELSGLRRKSWLEWQKRRAELGILGQRKTLWDADHITPVVEGGGECGLDGMRTLCLWCHKDETKALAGRLAKKKQTEDAQKTTASEPGEILTR